MTDKKFTLPNDIARCSGVGEDGNWRECCENCLRRIVPPGDCAVFMEPPVVIAFWCEFLIDA